MKENIDIRVQKTYNMLMAAFTKLIVEKKYEDITINELCSAAGIRRATFYQHFNDKLAFFVFLIKQLYKKEKDSSTYLYTSTDNQTFYINLCRYMLELLEKNEKLINGIIKNNMFSLTSDIIIKEIVNDVELKLKDDNSSNYNHEMFVCFISGGVAKLSKWWFLNKETVKKEEVISEITRLINNLELIK